MRASPDPVPDRRISLDAARLVTERLLRSSRLVSVRDVICECGADPDVVMRAFRAMERDGVAVVREGFHKRPFLEAK